MCGRFTLKTPVANWLADLFPNWHEGVAFANENVPIELTRSRYNIAPSQSILVFHVDSDGVTHAALLFRIGISELALIATVFAGATNLTCSPNLVSNSCT